MYDGTPLWCHQWYIIFNKSYAYCMMEPHFDAINDILSLINARCTIYKSQSSICICNPSCWDVARVLLMMWIIFWLLNVSSTGAGLMVVVKLDGQPYLCKTDEVGELCLSAPYTGMGYWGLQGITNTTFKVQPLGGDSKPIGDHTFVRTGLLGFLGPVSRRLVIEVSEKFDRYPYFENNYFLI